MALFKQLWVQVLLATLAGIALGHWWPRLGVELKPLGDAFIALVRMLIAPVIFCTVVHGVAAMNDMRRVGRVALKALIYFEVITTLALVFALVAVNLLKPGSGMHVAAGSLDLQSVTQYTAKAHAQGVAEFLLNIIPATFVDAFAHTEVLPVLFVSVLFAAGLAACGERGKPVKDVIDSVREVFFRIVGFVMWAAPLGAFGSMAFTVGRFGTGSLQALGRLILTLYGVSAVFVIVVFGAISWWCGISLWRLLGYIREEIVIVAATTSTETVLPQVMRKMRALGCEDTVVGLVVPTGYSFNLDGTCLYLATVVVFLAQATDTPLGLTSQLGFLAVLLLTSKGAAGVAGAAFVVLAATLGSMGNIPVASIALVLGIHRLLAEALTFVNLVGNCLATLVVARWEGALDGEVLRRQIGRRPAAASPEPSDMKPTSQELIAKLGLEPHQEGGWFRQVYKSPTQLQAPQGRRSAVTTIYYLLEHNRASPWHVVESDEIWHFYYGAPSELFSYDPVLRKLVRHRLDSVTGEGVQVAVIPAGNWQAAHCLGEYLLVGCTVSPGYENQDFRWVRELPGHRQHFTGAMMGLQAFL